MTETEINNSNTEAKIRWESGKPHFLYGYLSDDQPGYPSYIIQRRIIEGYRLFSRGFHYITDFKSLKSAKACAERLAMREASTTPDVLRKLLIGFHSDIYEILRQL